MCVRRVAPRFVRLATLLVFAGLFGFGPAALPGAGPAFAQSRSSETALRDEIERLRNDLIDLQKFVYGGGGNVASPSAAAPDDGEAASGTTATSSNARLQLRIQQLETQIRDVTGRVEEASFLMRQLSLRMDKLVSDVDFRLQTLERSVGVGPTAGLSSGARTNPQTAPAQQGTTVITSSGASVSASELPVAPGGELQPGQQPLAYMRQSQLDSDTPAGTAPEIAPQAAARRVESAPVATPSAAPAPGSVSSEGTVARLQLEAAEPILPDGTPEEQYRFAFDLVRKQQFPEAERALRAFVDTHPEHDLAGNAMYWLGETYYAQQRYRDSAAVFVDAYSNYPKGPKASHSLLKLGMSLGALGKTEAACTSFQELRKRFPETEDRVLRKADSESKKLGCRTG